MLPVRVSDEKAMLVGSVPRTRGPAGDQAAIARQVCALPGRAPSRRSSQEEMNEEEAALRRSDSVAAERPV